MADGGSDGHGGAGRPGRKPAGNGGLEVIEETSDGILVVSPVGRVDSGTAGTLEKRLLERLAQGERRVVIDLGDVSYISSAGLRVLLLILNKLKALGGRLALCSMGHSVREVFELAGFTTIFVIEGSRELARARVLQQTT
jgi:anti-sigma B factor antagonist